MKWITRKNVGIDRISCAWLIKRYIDSEAVFDFVDYDEDIKEDSGIPFDIPSCKYSHRRGRCSFNTLIKEYNLNNSILDSIAKIIDGADCVSDIVPSPESYGLEAICLGLRKYLGDDLQSVTQGEIIFDALYAYLSENK
ncbi:MAG: chromate resistance protein [Oscillospiraceae bacterium]|nr:chromate resistance protein [Oscillospiraceae bacterium]